MATPNVVPFLSSDGAGNDLNQARKLYDTNASLSFRQHAKYSNSPLPFLDRRSVAGSAAFQFYMFGDTPEPEQEYQSGTELEGQDYALASASVGVDDIITAHKAIGRKDMAVSHIAMAPILGTENGRKVSVSLDRRILNQLALAPRSASLSNTTNGLKIHNGGFRVTRSSSLGGTPTVAAALTAAYPLSATGAANLRADLRSLGYTADTNFWPEESRYIVMDAYLRQVLMYDTSLNLFSKDYQEENKILNRTITLIDGWRVFAWEKRVGQGGLMPDANITSFVKSTKFNNNYTPGASTGYPAVLAFSAAGEDQAPVGFGEWLGVTSIVEPPYRNHTWFYETFCLCGIGTEKVYNAASVEVLN